MPAGINLPDVGTGATLTFESGICATIDSIEWSGFNRSFSDISHLGTTGGRDFKPGDLYDPGSLTVSMRWSKDQNFLNVIDNAPAAITLTFPTQSPESTPTSIAGTAFLTSFGGTIPLEEVMTCRAEIKFTGDLTFTASVQP